MESQPSAMPSTSFERITRLMSMLYTTLRTFGSTWPENFSSPSPSARPRPSPPIQPRIEADHLPHRIQAEAARHDRIVLEMAAEEPEIRLHIEFGADQALAVFAAGLGDFRDAVEHQHRRQRQLGIAGAEHLAAAAGQQILVFITVAPIQHRIQPLSDVPMERFERTGPVSPRENACFPQIGAT